MHKTSIYESLIVDFNKLDVKILDFFYYSFKVFVQIVVNDRG